jgi:hypothetical protein
MVRTLTPEQARAEFIAVSTILAAQYETRTAATFTVAAAEGAGIGALTAV